jgi:flagellar biogenesis protein FliO
MGGAAAKPEVKEEAQPAEAIEETKPQPQPAASGLLSRAWSWLQKNNKFSVAKQLRVAETISLGEKRFVALVDIDGQKFLIGGGASGVSLLTQLGANDSAADALPAIAAAAGQSK